MEDAHEWGFAPDLDCRYVHNLLLTSFDGGKPSSSWMASISYSPSCYHHVCESLALFDRNKDVIGRMETFRGTVIVCTTDGTMVDIIIRIIACLAIYNGNEQ
jgi:hypothetical protein